MTNPWDYQFSFVSYSKANGSFEMVERDISEPDATQVRIKVQACGL
jgi:D-arabinose 1-dehydrogenase-like Zn-dependent alcohol dehydrogenase